MDALIFIPSLLLVQFFRRIRPRDSHRQISPVLVALSKVRSTTIERAVDKGKSKKKGPCSLSWWCLYIAYGFSFILVLVSTFFIIARGIEFGDIQCQKWLTSLLSGFFSSILLSEPIKVCIEFPLSVKTIALFCLDRLFGYFLRIYHSPSRYR